MNYFEKYDIISREYCQINSIISSLVRNYLKDTFDFDNEEGNLIKWSILDNDTIQILYSVHVYTDDIYSLYDEKVKCIKVKYDEIIKYKEHD